MLWVLHEFLSWENTVHVSPQRRGPSFYFPELDSAASHSRTFHVRFKGGGSVRWGRRSWSTLCISAFSASCLVASCSGFFFLFSYFLLVKAALLYTFSKLTKCHFGEDWLDFQGQMKPTPHKCHPAGISNSPFTHMGPLYFFAPWGQAWPCDMLWPKRCEPERYVSLLGRSIKSLRMIFRFLSFPFLLVTATLPDREGSEKATQPPRET